MSEPQSALVGAVSEGTVRIEDSGPRGMITLRGDLASESFRDVVGRLAETSIPDRLSASFTGDRGLCWMSPDELLLICPHADAPGLTTALGHELAGMHHLAVDVSDARALINVTGPATREVLAKLTPADMSPSAFPPGGFRRTRLAQVPAAFWLTDEGNAGVICFRSVARYVFDILAVSARTGGEVGYFTRP